MLRRALLAVCLLATACIGGSPPPAGAQEKPLAIHNQRLVFKLDEPAATEIGRLIWRGGVEMKADSPNFGGWSDLHVSADGRSLTSISDEGAWFTATIDYSDYTWGGWYADSALQTPYEFGTMPGHDLPLYAKWVAPSYTVTFNTDGGNTMVSSWLMLLHR